jgi:hypothetical protein
MKTKFHQTNEIVYPNFFLVCILPYEKPVITFPPDKRYSDFESFATDVGNESKDIIHSNLPWRLKTTR